MKKLKNKKMFGIAAIFLLAFISGCSFYTEEVEGSSYIYKEDDGPRPKKKIKFKHNGCNDPLGICVLIPIGSKTDEIISEDEKKDFVGLASFKLLNDSTLEIAPERNIALSDGTVPITEDIYVLPEVVLEYKNKFSVIKKGEYKIDYSKNMPFGVVRVNVTK